MIKINYEYLLVSINTLLCVAVLGVVVAALIPQLHSFLKYGKTLNNSVSIPFLNIYLPKRWFTHFYIIDYFLSLINLVYFTRNSSRIDRFFIISLLNQLQSLRRLYECLFISKFSQTAKIHVFHYLVGVFFYTSINFIPFCMFNSNHSHQVSAAELTISLSLFIVSSWDQLKNHYTLSVQKKYTLPNEGLFQWVVCSHYFDEILIYLSQLILVPSMSYLLIVVWVTVNLSISANESYHFYKQNNELNKHYRIIPFVY